MDNRREPAVRSFRPSASQSVGRFRRSTPLKEVNPILLILIGSYSRSNAGEQVLAFEAMNFFDPAHTLCETRKRGKDGCAVLCKVNSQNDGRHKTQVWNR